MPQRLVLAVLLVAVSLLGLAACGASATDGAADGRRSTSTPGDGGGDGGTTPDPPETTEGGDQGGDDVCAPLRVISDFDVESAQFIAATVDYDEIVGYLEDRTPDVLAAYEDAIAVADDDLADDLREIRDFTEVFLRTARSSSDFQELESALFAEPATTDAGLAAMRLDRFAVDTCGFSTGDN